MFFAKDEIIELDDQKKYLILEVIIFKDETYYQIQEVKANNLVGSKVIIKAINDNGNLYIEDLTEPEILNEIEKRFTS